MSIGVYFMFARLIPDEKWKWYFQDLALPIGAAVLAAAVLRALMPTDLRTLPELAYLAFAGASITATAALSCPMGFGIVRAWMKSRLRPTQA